MTVGNLEIVAKLGRNFEPSVAIGLTGIYSMSMPFKTFHWCFCFAREFS